PGIAVDQDRPGHYIFQFYHVHPAWIAIFGGLLGLDHATWSQTFFGLLSLLFAALIVERLSGQWAFGVATAGVFAVLPLHVFFSKMPISEMPTLTLALLGIYAITRAAESGGSPNPRWLVLAGLAFCALFLSRISGFVYLPVIYLGAILNQVFVDGTRARRRWALFWFSLIAFYAGSVVYGLIWSGPYSISIYHMHFGFHMLRWLPWVLLAGTFAAAVPFIFLQRISIRIRTRDVLLRLWTIAQPWLPVLLLLLVIAGAARAGVLAFTDHYRGNAWYDQTWGMSHAGTDAILRSALLVAAEHLGPALVLLLPFALWKPGFSASRVLITAMVIVMIGYTAVLQWFLPYQYYYARYLLSEVVPFAILLMALRCADGWQRPALRPWIASVGICTGIYAAWFTWPLIGLDEASGAERSLARIASQLDHRSALLVDETSIRDPSRFITPLRAWFGKSVYAVRDMNEITVIVRDLRRAGIDNVQLLTADRSIPASFGSPTKVRFEQLAMKRSPTIPRETEIDAIDFLLSTFDDGLFSAAALTSAEGMDATELPRGCCKGIPAGDIWTGAQASIHGLALPSGTWHRLIVTMRGHRPNYADSGLIIRVNGEPLHLEGIDGKTFTFSLGEHTGPMSFDIDLETTTFVPREFGINDDPRSLGVDIATLRVE
ncbi:MAG: hypothetical protein ACREPX_11275, partial [Rhodanobacteraceae bacterium]